MKIAKRIVSALLLVAMLASLMMLASCGIFRSRVERKFAKLEDAKNYTMVYTTDTYEETVMVDFKHLKIYIFHDSADRDTETYYWMDEEKGDFYCARVEQYGEMTKERVSKSEFFDVLCDYVKTDKAVDFAYCVKETSLYEKVDRAFVYKGEYGDGDWYKSTYKVEKRVLVCEYESSYSGKTVTKYYDINRTKFKIPQDILEADYQ